MRPGYPRGPHLIGSGALACDRGIRNGVADTWRAGVSGKSRSARVLGRVMRQTSVFDRKGTRWMIQALSPPPTVIILVHRGRKSGTVYKTPLSILAEDPERGELVVGPMWGKDADWYRNVIADGLVEIHIRGEKRHVVWRELDETERRAAGEAFRDAHRIYSRMILRVLARLNGLEGDPGEAAVQHLPMLNLSRVRAPATQGGSGGSATARSRSRARL